jgi:ketosteroid isomerase-like protein
MKTKSILLLFALMLVFVSCVPKTTVNKDQALADSLLQVNINAYNSGDAQVIANMFTDDALLIGPSGKRTWSKDSIYAASKAVVPIIKSFKAWLGPTTVTENLIQMQKYFTVDGVVGDAKLKAKGVAIIVWEKQADKSWKIVLEIEDYDMKPY